MKSYLIIQSEEEGAPAPWAKTTTGDNFPSVEDGDGDGGGGDKGGDEAISTSIQNDDVQNNDKKFFFSFFSFFGGQWAQHR